MERFRHVGALHCQGEKKDEEKDRLVNDTVRKISVEMAPVRQRGAQGTSTADIEKKIKR